MGKIILVLAALTLTGCATGGTDWRGMSQMYNSQMNYEYEQINKYRQGPALRQPAQEITVQQCTTWPYCPR